MKCYFCKKEISIAMRTFVKARGNREKDNFRDLCKPCYLENLDTELLSPLLIENEEEQK